MNGKKLEAGEDVVLVDYGHIRTDMRVLSTRVASVGTLWATIDHPGYTKYKFDALTGLVKCTGIGAGWQIRILRPETWEARARGWRRWAPLWVVRRRTERGP